MSPNKQLSAVLKKYNGHPEFLGTPIVDPNQHGAFDSTLLHIAAEKGALEDMQVLIAAGAKVNEPGDLGNTPLHAAAMAGQIEAVKLLLQHGANPALANEHGQSTQDVARLGKRGDIVGLLKSRKTKQQFPAPSEGGVVGRGVRARARARRRRARRRHRPDESG